MQNFSQISEANSDSGKPTNSRAIGRYPGNSAAAMAPSGFAHAQQQNVEVNHAKSGNIMIAAGHGADKSETDRAGSTVVGPAIAEPSQQAQLLTWTMECKQWQKQRAFTRDEGSTFAKYQIAYQTFQPDLSMASGPPSPAQLATTTGRIKALAAHTAADRALASRLNTPRIGG